MRTGAALGLLALLGTACGRIRVPALRTPAPARTSLDVPYVPQSVLLCGGAALAMIERWWGRRAVFAEEFATLVHRDEGGIRTSDMDSTMRARGWQVRSGAATPGDLARSLADSVPVIALIQVAAGRYHFVVVTAWAHGRVTYHDPAVAPSVNDDSASFIRRWSGARRWALFVQPGTQPAPPVLAPPVTQGAANAPDSLPCRPWLDRAADAAAASRFTNAEQFLDTAATACPAEPLVLRERAGLRFRQGRRADAVQLAADYTRRAPRDTLGWLLLATSRFLAGDHDGALRAWNVVGRPTLDLVRIDGLTRSRYALVNTALALSPAQPLRAPRLALARRRLADLPALTSTQIGVSMVAGGMAEVRASVIDRPLLAPLAQVLPTLAVNAAVRRDVRVSLYSPLRAGDVWTAQWRWQPSDPRVALHLAIPARPGIPGVAHLERSWTRYRFDAGVPEQRRDVASMDFRAWTHRAVEGLVGATLERWDGIGEYATLALGVGVHDARDRIALLVEGDHAAALDSGRPYTRVRTRVAWRLPISPASGTWAMRLGSEWTSRHTPLGGRPLAGGDPGRDIPLRAHPFIVDRTLPTSRIANIITFGGASGDRTITSVGVLAIGAGVFVDAARVHASVGGPLQTRTYVDGGAGLRFGVAGADFATVRVDLARGLTVDRRWALSAGVMPAWPMRLGRSR